MPHGRTRGDAIVQIVPETPEGIAAAAEALRRGEIVAYPTETVYGLGADPFSEEAMRKLYALKDRDASKPVLVIVGGLDQLEPVAAKDLGPAAAYIQAFWPGPLSLLLPKAPGLPTALTGPDGRVCVRCPASSTARQLCEAFGGAITSTSANRSGQRPAQSLGEIDAQGVAVGIDGGRLGASPPSTVFDPENTEILREGCIAQAQLEAVAHKALAPRPRSH